MANHSNPALDHDNDVVHHEESDVNIRWIFGFALGLFIVAVVVHVLIYVLFVFFANEQASANANSRQYPLAVGQENRLPPEPRLQVNPKQDLRDLRAQEDDTLNGYSWVDRNGGVVRIPIADAMKLAIRRGLPSRPQTPSQSGQGNASASATQGSATGTRK